MSVLLISIARLPVASTGMELLLLICVLAAQSLSLSRDGPAAAVAEREVPWTQDVFAIGNWVPPPIPTAGGIDVEARIAEFAGANFTVLLGTGYYGLEMGADVLLAVAKAADKHSLKIVPFVNISGSINRASGVSDAMVHPVPAAVSSSPSFWGFQFYDEPNTRVFPALADLSRQVAARYPGKVRFINLLPNYAWGAGCPGWPDCQGAKNYTAYIDEYVDVMLKTNSTGGGGGPNILSTDHYPFFELPVGSNSSTSIAGYRANLGVLRVVSLRLRVPFWNFFNVEGFGGHPDPTEAEIRWQVYTSLAYGSKGVLYYCYNGIGKGLCGLGGILSNRQQGTQPVKLLPSHHYQQARRINSELKIFGVHLVTATSTGIFRVLPPGSADTGETGTCNRGERNCPDGEQPTTDLSTCALVVNASDAETFAVSPRLPGNGLLIGQFALADGRTALLLVNQNWGSTLWPIFSFSGSAKNAAAAGVLEVDPGSGEEALVFDDSPGVDATGARFHSLGSIQLAFGAAAARLLILPRHG
jgi:hypothetical protein